MVTMKKKGNNQGVTLIELIVVMAIMGIILALSFSGINWLNEANIKKASSNISGQLDLLRNKSMSKDGNWRMEIVEEGGMYYTKIYDSDTDTDPDVTALGNRIKVYKMITDTDKELIKEDPVSGDVFAIIRFDRSSGQVTQGDMGYIVENGYDTVTIKLISLTGRNFIE